jgi:hypothetical protein
MRVQSSGNVSINNTNDTYKLDVTGTARLTGQLRLESTITDGTYTYTLPSATGTLALTSALSGYLPLTGGTLTGALGGTSASFSSSVTAVGFVANMGSTNTEGLLIQRANTSSNAIIKFKNNTTDTWILGNRNTGDETFRLYNYNVGADVITVTNGGNVGIGTTSPGTSKLYVSGDVTNYGITSEAPSGYGKLILKQTSGQAWSVGLSSNDLFFYYGGTSAGTRVTFANGGNVGIGTTSPTTKLTVYGGYANFTDGTANVYIGSDGSNGLFGTINNYDQRFITNNVERMRITSGGYLLLGTTTATYGQAGRGTFEMNGSTDNITVQKVGGSLANYIYSDATKSELYSTNFLQVSVNGAERMRITSGGLVGIGTSSVGYTLHVQKSISGNVLSMFYNDANSGADTALITRLGSNCNNTGSYYFTGGIYGVADKIYIYGNGNIVNTNNSYGAISDIRLKENISDTTSKLADLLKVKVRNYNLIGDDKKQLGVIAQELETIFPSMIEVDGKSGMKQVKYSVFVPMLIKAIQELNDKINK